MKKSKALETQKKTSDFTNQLNDFNNLIEEINKLYESGNYELVISKCNEEEAKYPDKNLIFWYNKALCLDYLDKTDAALDYMQKILKQDPQHTGARSWMAAYEFDKEFDDQSLDLNANLLDKIKAYAIKLASNKDLISSINRMCQMFDGKQLQDAQAAIDFKKNFDEETKNKENDPNYKIDFSKMKTYLDNIKNQQENIQKLEDIEKIAKELRNNHPEDFTKFSKLFFFMIRLENIEKKFQPQLEHISSLIGINYENLKFYFKLLNNLKEDENENENSTVDDISMPSNFPEFKKHPFDKTCKPLGQILHELVLDMTQENSNLEKMPQNLIDDYVKMEENNLLTALNLYKSKFSSNGGIVDLINGYEKVANYSLQCQNMTAGDVRNWAKQVRGNLNNLHEAIAVMDRANSLITGGHRLRHTQILSLLIFFESQESQGKLLQISTGEGKTLIVSLFVALKALKGETIDVITSNNVLAEEGAKEREKFYNLLNLSVATNNPDRKNQTFDKNVYKADILYGCISNFQFDYLRDSFEGLGTRANRKFDTVMIDEVDSMLIDNGGHIAKLSGPLPGMESLRHIYIKIWIEISKKEKLVLDEYKGQIESKKNELKMKNLNRSDFETQLLECHDSLLKTNTDKIKQQVKESVSLKEFTNLIPSHLIEFANRKLDLWIDNAIYAKFYCYENKQYLIKKKNDEDIIVPIDYENTGVTLKNTIWSNGLHQFVQLKHNLYLTSESLTSSFISNIGYIKKYKNIYGLTGTLGSVAEQDLLSSVYNLKYAKIPTYKTKKFKEIYLVTVNESDLGKRVAIDSLEICECGRAVLIICETIENLNTINKSFDILKIIEPKAKINIKTFPDEDSSKITEDKLNPGDIILSTNIAGRGTDFKTTKEVEQNGGLHVIVTFLPCNKRVEEQAFGRTSRQGNNGTAQIIMSGNEIFNRLNGGSILKELRDQAEKARINEIKNVKLAEINYNDKIFSLFSDVYVKLYKKHKNDKEYPHFLNDLKEYWAFWLDKNGNSKEKSLSQAESDFERFKSDANEIINGKIKHNPYYCLRLANSLMDNDKLDKAREILNNGLNIGNSSDLLYSAYIKLFEIEIEKGNQLTERFVKALASIIFINYTKDENYKVKGLENLQKAKNAIEKEIKFIKTLVDSSDFSLIITVPKEKNFFLKHLLSRYTCLNVYSSNIDSLIEQMGTSEGITLGKKVPDYLKTIDDEKIKNAITESEVSEIEFVGLNEIYSLKVVYDASKEVIDRAKIQIGSGLATLAIGIAFPPVLPICGPIAGALISEGVCDIVLELISKGESEFSESDYRKSKTISYGISIATMGLSAIASSLKILARASKACRAMSTFFRKSPFLKKIFEKVADQLTKLANYFEKLHLDKLNSKLNHLGNVTRKELLKSSLKEIGIDSVKTSLSYVIDEKITRPMLEKTLESLKPQIRKEIESKINKNEELNLKLSKTYLEDVEEHVKEILDGDTLEQAIEIAKQITLGVMSQSRHSWIKNASLLLNSLISIPKIFKFTDDFLSKLVNKISLDEDKSNSESLVNKTKINLTDQLTNKLFLMIIELTSKFTNKFIKDPLVNKMFDVFNKKDPVTGGELIKFENPQHNLNENVKKSCEILGVRPNATREEIDRAFRNAAFDAHPDRGGSTEKWTRVTNARDDLIQHCFNPNSNTPSHNNTNRNEKPNTSDKQGGGEGIWIIEKFAETDFKSPEDPNDNDDEKDNEKDNKNDNGNP